MAAGEIDLDLGLWAESGRGTRRSLGEGVEGSAGGASPAETWCAASLFSLCASQIGIALAASLFSLCASQIEIGVVKWLSLTLPIKPACPIFPLPPVDIFLPPATADRSAAAFFREAPLPRAEAHAQQ